MLVIKDKKKFITRITALLIAFITIICLLIFIISKIITVFTTPQNNNKKEQQQTISQQENPPIQNKSTKTSTSVDNPVLNEWNLKLVNKDNSVDKSYVPELEELDDGVKFDKRAVSYLKQMINAMYKENITKVWVQSAYRSYEKQEELFNRKVKQYKEQGKEQEEAERLAQKIVQRPEMSEHNLALAADFNTVTNEFEDTKAFAWLQKHAWEYGFILRYPKDKQDITGITYESWHWRYVGKEHAKIIKEKGYCLEEYIEYLKGAKEV